jgi:prolactin regulatory element-binding protein
MALVDELELQKGEDAPMSMAADGQTNNIVCGINSAEENLKDGPNQNCRKFAVQDGKYVLVTLSGFTAATIS